MHSILIQNGTIYDGLGNPPFSGDLLIIDDKIADIAPSLFLPADQTIDASGYIVTPGFIDIHRHCDILPFSNENYADAMLAQGITSTVAGNCGISMAPLSSIPSEASLARSFTAPVLGPDFGNTIINFPEYLNALKSRKLPVNFASFIGTGSVKISVKGFSNTPFTVKELSKIHIILEEALTTGAAGISVGIMYQPECYNTTEDYIEMLKPISKYHTIIAAHIRDEGDGLFDSIKEMIEIGHALHCSIEISHFKSCNKNNWRREIYRAIQLIEQAQKDGLDIGCDLYPYDCGSTALSSLLPPSFVNGNLKHAFQKLGTEKGIEDYRKAGAVYYGGWKRWEEILGWDRILISGTPNEENRKYLGKSIAESVKQYGFQDGCELVAHLLYSDDGKTSLINKTMCQEDIDTIASLPYSIFISDSIYGKTDTPHPRMYGSFPKIIREYVKERHILSLEEAIRKMTSLPAARIQLEKRGSLQKGYYADINIFKPEEFRDRATYDNPRQLATGLHYCIINGKTAYKDGSSVSVENGRLLRIPH